MRALVVDTGICGVDTAPLTLRVRGRTRSQGAVFRKTIFAQKLAKTEAVAAIDFRPEKVVLSPTFDNLFFEWGSVFLTTQIIFRGGGFVRAPCPPLRAYFPVWLKNHGELAKRR